jgi:hypothetical protein
MRRGPGKETAVPRAGRNPALSLDRIWALIAIAIPAAGGLAIKMSTVDLAYHLRLGDQILHGTFPRVDSFTFSASGLPWIDQQWGAQVLMTLAHGPDGWNSLLLLKAALIAVTFVFVFRACRSAGASVRAAAGLTVAGYLVSAQNMGMRPQLFAAPLFAVVLWISAGRREHPARQWAIPLLVVIWCNVHGSFVLGPALVGLDWLEDLRTRWPGARRTFLIGAVSAAATLVNPFGWRVWTYTVEIATNPTITRFASEWEPTTIRTFTGVALFVSVAGVVVFFSRRSGPVPWTTLLRLGFFFALALPAIRGALWWGLAAPPALASCLAPRAASEGDDRRGSPLMNRIMVAAVVLGLVVTLPWWRSSGSGGASPPLLVEAPDDLVAAAALATDPGDHLWVDQVWGSWFEYRLPDRLMFVDSRIELFPRSVWSDYLDAANGREGWQDILDRWDVEVAVLSAEQSGELLERMARDDGWRRAFSTDDGSVYVRT